MIKIAVFGHSPESFSDAKSLANNIDDAIAIIKRQHAEEKDISFSLNGEPGASQWFCNALIEQQLPYEIYLSSIPGTQSQDWSEIQQEHFIWQLSKSKAIHVCGADNSFESRIKRDKNMIDSAQWLLVFWNKKHQGCTFNAIDYAIKSNKIVYNGMGNLHIIDGNALKVRNVLNERI